MRFEAQRKLKYKNNAWLTVSGEPWSKVHNVVKKKCLTSKKTLN